MTILLPTACCISGVIGWNVYQRVTLRGWFPSAATASLQPAGGGLDGSCPRGALGVPLPAALGSVMKTQPVVAGGFWGDPCGLPAVGIGPVGHWMARTAA